MLMKNVLKALCETAALLASVAIFIPPIGSNEAGEYIADPTRLAASAILFLISRVLRHGAAVTGVVISLSETIPFCGIFWIAQLAIGKLVVLA